MFGTAGFGGSAEYFEQILAAVQKSLDESNTVIGTYMCQGKMPMTVRQQYEKMLQQPNHAPNLEMLIENFDKALAHPDAAEPRPAAQKGGRGAGITEELFKKADF